jgi:DNA-binding cell septation regulator SpoVG
MPDDERPTADIEVLEIRSVTDSGNIRAFATVRLGGVTLMGCKVIREDGKRPWVAMPDRQWTAEDGQRRWSQAVKLTAALKQRVDDAVLSAWEGA